MSVGPAADDGPLTVTVLVPPTPKPIYVADTSRHLGNAVDPQPRDVILCTYPDTLDGWLAAWVIRGVAKQYALHLEFQLDTAPLPDLADRNWIALGVPPNHNQVPGPRSVAVIAAGPRVHASTLLPFIKWERAVPFGVKSFTGGAMVSGTFAAPGSLASVAYNFFHASRLGFVSRPRLFDYLEDVSTPHPRLNGSAALIECVKSYEPSFATLDKLVEATDDRKRREMMFVAGQAIQRYVARRQSVVGPYSWPAPQKTTDPSS